MVRPRERIEQDLAGLEEALAALNLEFRSTYEGYLTALGQAVRQQLILACYHLCTQAVPESFLKLSFEGRQKMQQSVKALAAESEEKLRSLVTESQAEEEIEEEEEEEEDEDDFDEEQEQEEEDEADDKEEDEKEKHQVSAINYLFSLANYQLPSTNSPESLARWQNSIEQSIANILKLLSRDTNRLLKLSEIEFADAGTSAWRQQIRNLSLKLNSLGRDYQKKQRELAVVEAESAWRASWF